MWAVAQLSDEWADARAPIDGVQGALGSLMHLKQRHPHLQVVLSIGGGACSNLFPIVAGNAHLRENLARSALGLVEASGLDGIDSKLRHEKIFLLIKAFSANQWPHASHGL